jgi:hypothetical protein
MESFTVTDQIFSQSIQDLAAACCEQNMPFEHETLVKIRNKMVKQAN